MLNADIHDSAVGKRPTPLSARRWREDDGLVLQAVGLMC